MANRKGEADIFTTTIRVPRDLYDQFRLVADRQHRTPSQEIRYLIERRVAGQLEEAA